MARRGSATGWLALGVSGVGAALLLGRAAGYHPPSCALLTHTGVACPVCGLTRLAVRLLEGDVATAVQLDPVGVILTAVVAVFAGGQVVAQTGRPVPWLRWRLVPLMLAVLLAARWALTVAAGGPPS